MRRSGLLTAAVLLLLGTPAASPGQLVPSAHPAPLPPIGAVDGKLVITVVYPPADDQLGLLDSTFLFGSTGTGRSELRIDGTPVPVAPNGAFLAWLPLPDDTVAVFHLVARQGGRTATAELRLRLQARYVPPGQGLWLDPHSVEPRGAIWAQPDEPIRVSARAAPEATVAVVLPDGRVFPLAREETGDGRRERRADRPGPRPVARFTGEVPATALGGALAALASPRVPGDSGGAAVAAVVASLGPDTVRMGLPARVTVLDPAAPAIVLLDDDTAHTGKARGTVIGAPAPHGAYQWFFLDGTHALADGRVGDQLRLRLSRESVAWVSMAEVAAALPPGTAAPRTIVRPVQLTPRDSSVEARFTLDARVPFRVEETERSITVRLYGATPAADSAPAGGTDPMVTRVIRAQPEADECTVTFELGAPVFGWRTRWEGNDVVLEIRRPPVVDPARPLFGRTIAVDPGHPPEGATGPTGLREQDANLAVGLALRDLLRREGARVVMTREADTALGLYERTALADRENAEILVSIHENALPDGVNPFTSNGTTVYWFHHQATRLAVLTEQALVGEMGLRDLGADRGNFALVRDSWMPAILTEGAFLMIPEQENALRTPSFQEAYARGIVLGIEAYLRELAAPPPSRGP